MTMTKDFAKRQATFGKTVWLARVWYDDNLSQTLPAEHDHVCGHREFPTEGLAKAWVTKRLLAAPEISWIDPDDDTVDFVPTWCGSIEPGRYEDCSFHDPGYGYVRDCEWISGDPHLFRSAWINHDDTVGWD